MFMREAQCMRGKRDVHNCKLVTGCMKGSVVFVGGNMMFVWEVRCMRGKHDVPWCSQL
jgi:hypothetical protein